MDKTGSAMTCSAYQEIPVHGGSAHACRKLLWVTRGLTYRRLAALGAAIALTGCGVSAGGGAQVRGDGSGAPAAPDRPYVVVLSFDGVRSDYLVRDTLPAFERVAAEGVRAASLTP